tara:strand:+ start:129 stop:752 length:624 start_codon:yes stop_codon:yes gene_type:complete
MASNSIKNVKRRKLFYPKGEQKLGLLTKGKEWMDAETNKEYKGPYHQFTDGVTMTLGAPSKRSRYLVPYKNLSTAGALAAEVYRKLTKVKVNKFISPKYHFPKVAVKDLGNGYITRYFVQKKNDLSSATITEIDKKQFEKVAEKNKPAINGKQYNKFLIRWKIIGTEEEIKNTNGTTLLRVERQYKGIRSYLGDLTELSKFSPINTE